jgi:4-deoxy-L-threo-5-hexosulose-uronate ketol-isomerase
MKFEERYAASLYDVKSYDTQRIRKDFLIENLFENNTVSLVYTLYDRYIAGGVVPVDKELHLETFHSLKADYFLQRRELGIINIGGKGKITADGHVYELNYKDALYLGQGTKEVYFISSDPSHPAKFYFNSTPAHNAYPSKLLTLNDAEKVVLGSLETANHRQINKLMVNSVLPTCQLQMGMTELKTGSVWNTMPAHTHNRRMEVYFYFEVPEGQAVCHFMGQPDETRHIWLKNEQAVISPPWSIHCGSGTSNYAFIWGMAGENLDYGDMDVCGINDLR